MQVVVRKRANKSLGSRLRLQSLALDGGFMNPKQEIYWHTTAQMPDETDPRPLPGRVDVAIIGGGFTGLSAAHTLAKAGASVAVLDAHSIGWGASRDDVGVARHRPARRARHRTAVRGQAGLAGRQLARYRRAGHRRRAGAVCRERRHRPRQRGATRRGTRGAFRVRRNCCPPRRTARQPVVEAAARACALLVSAPARRAAGRERGRGERSVACAKCNALPDRPDDPPHLLAPRAFARNVYSAPSIGECLTPVVPAFT